MVVPIGHTMTMTHSPCTCDVCIHVLINLHNMHPQRGIQLVLSVLLCTVCMTMHEVGRPAHNHPTDDRTLGTTTSGPGDLDPMGHTSCVM